MAFESPRACSALGRIRHVFPSPGTWSCAQRPWVRLGHSTGTSRGPWSRPVAGAWGLRESRVTLADLGRATGGREEFRAEVNKVKEKAESCQPPRTALINHVRNGECLHCWPRMQLRGHLSHWTRDPHPRVQPVGEASSHGFSLVKTSTQILVPNSIPERAAMGDRAHPVTAVTGGHTSGGRKQHRSVSLRPGGQKPEVSLMEPKSRCPGGVPLGGSRAELVPRPCPTSGGARVPLLPSPPHTAPASRPAATRPLVSLGSGSPLPGSRQDTDCTEGHLTPPAKSLCR